MTDGVATRAGRETDAPRLSGVAWLRELLPGGRRMLLHAGPPFRTPNEIPKPVWNSLTTACVFEGWVADVDEAAQALGAGEVELMPAQDHAVVVPLCGVASPSMALLAIRGANEHARPTYAVFNEGMDHALRLGVLDPELPAHHRWLNEEFALWLAGRLRDPIELYPLIAGSLAQGDDGHSRTTAASREIVEILLARSDGGATPRRVMTFLQSAPSFALNVWMAASAFALRAAATAAGPVVGCAGANGVRFGIKLSPDSSPWVTTPAPTPAGSVEPRFDGRIPLGAVGDSPVVDFFGLGGMALEHAPTVVDALREFLPPDALTLSARLLGPEVEGLGGRQAILSARRVVDANRGPLIVLGMIDAAGEAGRIGGGVVELEVDIFERALMAVA